MKALLAFAFAALFAAESFGVDAVWKNTATADQEWWTAANWKDASTGETLTEPPVTTGSTATFPDIDKTVRRVNLMGSAYDDRTQAPVIDSITGGEYWRLALPPGNNSWGRCSRSVKVGDVNGFMGEWYSDGACQTLDLLNTTTDQKLQIVYPHYQFPIKVPAGITAEMGYVRGSTGAIAKEGAGKLRIGTVMDAETLQLQLNEGEVELSGVIGPEDEIIKKAYYHLDANLPDTMEWYTDEDGRTRVTKWFDANGSGRYAAIWDNSKDGTASHIKLVNAPFIKANDSTTGLSIMDFGCNSASPSGYTQYGPTNCVLRFDTRLTNVCEIIWVAGWNNNFAPAFGDVDTYTLTGSDTYIFNYGHTITNGGGAFWQNGNYRAEVPYRVGTMDRYSTPVDAYTPAFRDLRLCDVKFGTDQKFYYIGSDRLYQSGGGSGGIKMGEALIFTNALTQAERQLVSDYLMKRWFAKRPQSMFRNVYAAADTAISVPAGRTAKIDNLVARGKVVKRGEGTLVIGRTVQEAEIEVEAGDVQFETKTVTVSTEGPAGTPQFWYDGDQEGCFVTDADGVAAWKDRRSEYATARQATRLTEAGKDFISPQVDTTSCPGHTVLSCPYWSGMSFPGTVGGAYAFQRETFIVFAFIDADGAQNYNFLPNSCYTFVRGTSRFLDPVSADDRGVGGVYTLDGVPEYPFESATGDRAFEVGRWYVASAAALSTLGMSAIARDGGRQRVGRLRVGEVITYSSALTEDERRQTVAYLMKKWLGKDHPETKEPAVKPVLEFPADQAAVLNTKTGMTVQSVAGGNGDLVKKGAGEATIVAELDESFGNVAVAEGSLVITKPTAPADRSQFHFDAMDTASYADGSYVDAEGETRVSKWLDTRANGVSANHIAAYQVSEKWFNPSNPIVRQVVCRDGVTRPIFDFLEWVNRSDVSDPADPKSAALAVVPAQEKSLEAICVFADNTKNAGTIDVFGTTVGNVQYFKRGTNGTLFRTNLADADVQNGYIWVDGALGASTSYVSGENYDLHVINIAPDNQHAYPMGAIAYLGSNNSGGVRYGEYMCFKERLNEKERTWWQNHLMYKWLGQGCGALWTNELEAVTVAKDATLTVAGGAIQAPTVTGGGTIEATRVMGIAALNLKVADRKTVEGLTVEGVADFAGAVAVTLTGTDAAKLKAGKYALVTATSFANLDLAQWTLATQLRNGYRFVQEENTVFLEVQPNGMLFIVR